MEFNEKELFNLKLDRAKTNVGILNGNWNHNLTHLATVYISLVSIIVIIINFYITSRNLYYIPVLIFFGILAVLVHIKMAFVNRDFSPKYESQKQILTKLYNSVV